MLSRSMEIKEKLRKSLGKQKRERGPIGAPWGPRGAPGAPPLSLFFCFPNDFLSFSLIFIDFDNIFKAILNMLEISQKSKKCPENPGKKTGKTGKFPYMVVSLCVFSCPAFWFRFKKLKGGSASADSVSTASSAGARSKTVRFPVPGSVPNRGSPSTWFGIC